MHYVIGTRGSKLAVAQAETVRTKLAETYPKDTFELRIISTKGDLMSDRPLHEIGGSGVFVREIEQQILSGEIQLGVHSMKDMPADPANGLTFAKAWKREDPRDVLILREKRSLWELPQGAVIGTGSKRRMLQLKKLRPDLIVTGIRGNVETRLLKMDQERLDGIVLAAAGMHRLGMQNRITQYLEADEMVPAPAQGILALEILEKEERLLSMLNALSDPDTVLAAEAERSFLREMGAGCHVPVGAVFRQDTSGNGRLLAMFGDGTKERQAYVSVSGTDPKEMAKQAAAGIRKKLAGRGEPVFSVEDADYGSRTEKTAGSRLHRVRQAGTKRAAGRSKKRLRTDICRKSQPESYDDAGGNPPSSGKKEHGISCGCAFERRRSLCVWARR